MKDEAFRFIGSAEFSGLAGELRFSGSLVEGDVNGDGVADLQIVLLGAPEIVATDFRL